MWAYHIDDFGEKQVSGILISQVLLFYCSDLTAAVGCYFLYQNFLHCTFVFPSGASTILPILNL